MLSIDSVRSLPWIVLLNKENVFLQDVYKNCHIQHQRDELVKKFRQMDDRPDGELSIYSTSAVDPKIFSDTMQKLKPLLLRRRKDPSSNVEAAGKPRIDHTDSEEKTKYSGPSGTTQPGSLGVPFSKNEPFREPQKRDQPPFHQQHTHRYEIAERPTILP